LYRLHLFNLLAAGHNQTNRSPTLLKVGHRPKIAHHGQRFLVNTQTGDSAPTAITVVLNWTAGLKK
jgi:phosphohistidine phosphatase SixA